MSLRYFATFILVLLSMAGVCPAYGQNVSGMISRVGDTTHLEFKGKKDWLYESPIKNKNQISVILPAFNDETVLRLENWTCPFIKNIKVDKNAPDGRYQVTFNLASENVESFDYLTDDPSDLILDFYVQSPKESTPVIMSENAAPVNEVKVAAAPKKNKKKIVAKNAASTSDEYKKMDRKPAGDELLQVGPQLPKTQSEDEAVDISLERGVFDGGDPEYNRFKIKNYQINENAIIASQQNIYLRFPILEQKLNRFDDLMKQTPIYELKVEDSNENKEARFLHMLFTKAKWGSFFETLKYFNIKYPQSKYDEIIKNMSAEAYIRLYERDKNPKDYEEFKSIYQYLVEKYPDSPLIERNRMLLAYSSLMYNDGAETLRLLQTYLEKYPKSAERDKARIAMAEAYQLLKKPSDAIDMYDAVIKDADDKNFSVESQYRKGDVLMSEEKYGQAVKVYSDSQKKYPEFKKIFANAQYNLGEAEFWQGHHKEALENYIEFLKLFPTHKYGGYALTRIGELLEIMGAPQQQVVGAFIEGYFRYPDSPGSEVARIRMLSQGLKSMPEREKKRAIAEIDDISKKSTLPRIGEFATLLKAEGYSKRKEFNDSLNLLLSYYQEHPTTADTKIFKVRILRNISDILKEQVDHNKYIDALNMFGKYSTTWLKNSNRIDTVYFQSVAYENADVMREAQKNYIKILSQLQSISGTKEEKERKVLENLPTISQVHLRLAAIALSEKRYRDSFKHIKDITAALTDKEEIEKVQISSEVAEQIGDLKSAVTNLENIVNKYSDQPQLVVQAQLKLIRLYTKLNRLQDAEKYVAKMEELKNKSGTLSDDEWAQTLELKGDVQFEKGQKLAAVETYAQLLESYESSHSLSAVRYKAGKILFDEGDLKGAEKFWAAFDEKMGKFYRKLAQEKLSQAEWQDSYKKYIERIPAAENLK